MTHTRRNILSVALAAPLVTALGSRALADDPRETERAVGKPDARVTVTEFYSLTCPHCARFAAETYPRIQSELIDTGRVRYVFGDFPLDQVALTAAMVARALPADRYPPFIAALLASQQRWAFDRSANTTEELWKRAALAGMDRPTFDATVADAAFRQWMLQQQQTYQTKYQVDSTPTFIVGSRKAAGEMTYDAFAQLVAEASS